MSRTRRTSLGAALLVLLAAAACSSADGSPAEDRQTGEGLYAALQCAGCHESAAIPGMIVIPLADLGARHDVASLAALLAAPTPPMPLFPLSEEQRRQLSVYLLERFP